MSCTRFAPRSLGVTTGLTRLGQIGILLLVMVLPLGILRVEPTEAALNTRGPTPPGDLQLTLNDALALFLRQNLDLLMAQYGIDTAKGQQITARLFPNPELTVGTLAAFTQGNTLRNSNSLAVSVQQLFEVANKRGYRIESARFGLQSAEANFEDTIRQLSFTVKDSYVQVQAARRRLALAEENRDRFSRILDINTIRLRKGFISGVDLIRLRLQVVDFESTVIEALKELESALNDLRIVLAVSPTVTLALLTDLDYRRVDPDPAALQRAALENRADIRMKQLIRAQREVDFKLARAFQYPDPAFGPGFTLQGPRGPDNPQQYTLGLSIPLPVFNRNQGGIVQAEVAVRAAETDLQKTLLAAQNDVNVVYRTLLQSRRLVEIYHGGVLEDARSSLSIIEAAYQRGGATILDLLDAARTSAAVQLDYVDALTAYQRNLFQLESAVGQEVTH
ncbi:TolC family protein [Nitrospira sp. Nam74]